MAAETPYGFGDYLKLAFQRQVNIPGLGTLPLNYMGLAVFGVLGIANPGFLFLGAAAEIAYLFGLASSKRFQNLVQGERLLAAQRTWESRVQENLERLSPDSRERYRNLLAQCRHILGISATLEGGDSLGNVRGLQSRNLNRLLSIFLRLLTTRQVMAENLDTHDRESLEKQIEILEARLANVDAEADAALARSIEGTLEIQRKRLDNRDKAERSLQVIGAELQRIEQQVQLLREEAAVSRKAEHLSGRLDAVTSVMSETSRWMDENSDIMADLGTPEEDIGPIPELPSLPRVSE